MKGGGCMCVGNYDPCQDDIGALKVKESRRRKKRLRLPEPSDKKKKKGKGIKISSNLPIPPTIFG